MEVGSELEAHLPSKFSKAQLQVFIIPVPAELPAS